MNLAAAAVLAPLLIALGGILSYFVAKLLPGKSLRWTGAFSAAWLGAVFVLLLAAGVTGSFGEVTFLGPILQPTPVGVAFGLLVTVPRGSGSPRIHGEAGSLTAPSSLYYPAPPLRPCRGVGGRFRP